jgi:hypothetical protein
MGIGIPLLSRREGFEDSSVPDLQSGKNGSRIVGREWSGRFRIFAPDNQYFDMKSTLCVQTLRNVFLWPRSSLSRRRLCEGEERGDTTSEVRNRNRGLRNYADEYQSGRLPGAYICSDMMTLVLAGFLKYLCYPRNLRLNNSGLKIFPPSTHLFPPSTPLFPPGALLYPPAGRGNPPR